MSKSVKEKFWSCVEKTSYCWNWTGFLDKSGLPIIRIAIKEGCGLKEFSPRRLSLEYHGRTISERVQPLICKNKLCVNPDHLVSGDKARFWAKVNVAGPDDCWIWTAGISQIHGYGKFTIKKQGISDIGAHRYSWILANGSIPDGMMICHICDNPPCVNPNHLFLGTAKDNAIDCVRKNRSARGERNGNSKLNEADVLKIKESCNLLQLSRTYDVSVRTILDIVTDRTWKHLK